MAKTTKQSRNSLSSIVKELAEYNRAHHTHITYGQYVVMMEGNGRIPHKTNAH